jgi:tryptophanyl-tRNA synthetase
MEGEEKKMSSSKKITNIQMNDNHAYVDLHCPKDSGTGCKQ